MQDKKDDKAKDWTPKRIASITIELYEDGGVSVKPSGPATVVALLDLLNDASRVILKKELQRQVAALQEARSPIQRPKMVFPVGHGGKG